MKPDPFNQVYRQTDPAREASDKENKEKQEFSWKDILAMTIAAYEVLLIPLGLFALAIMILILLINLLA